MGAVSELTKFYGLYAVRTVFNQGALRNGYVRFGLAIIACAWLAFTVVAPFLFFQGTTFESKEAVLLEIILSFNTLVWVQLAFLIVKTVFLTADGMSEFTTFLPVTNRQRAQALLAFEAFAMVIIVVYGTFGLAVWAVIQLGTDGLLLVVFSTLLPALLTYGILAVSWNGLTALLSLTPLRRIAPLMANIALIIPIYLTLASQEDAAGQLATRYETGNRDVLWVTACVDAAAIHGELLTSIVWMFAAAAFFGISLALVPRRPVRSSAFVAIPLPNSLSPAVLSHVAYVLRSNYTWDALVMALVLAIWLHSNAMPAVVATSMLCISGLYMYGSGGVKAWRILARPAPWLQYALMVSSLAFAAITISLPFLVFAGALGWMSVADVGLACVSVCVGAIMFTMVGVLFPAERDNPFSALVGLGSLLLVALFLGVVAGLFNLRGVGVPLAAVGILALIVVVSAAAIASLERKERCGT